MRCIGIVFLMVLTASPVLAQTSAKRAPKPTATAVADQGTGTVTHKLPPTCKVAPLSAELAASKEAKSTSEDRDTVIQICTALLNQCKQKCETAFSYSPIKKYICIASCETAAGTCILTAENCL